MTLSCKTCHGSGEILIGWTWGTRISPPDPVEGRCPVCNGKGEVPPSNLERFGGAFPSEAVAEGLYYDELHAAEEASHGF